MSKEKRLNLDETLQDEARKYWMLEGVEPGGGFLKVVDGHKAPTTLTQDIRIVDCDTHFTEPADLWTSRAPAKFKGRVPHVRRVDGMDTWFVDDINAGTLGGAVIDPERNKLLGKLSFPTYEEMHPAAYQVEPRLKIMDEYGIWAQICYQNAGCTQIGTLMSLQDRELAKAVVSIFNDAAAERQAESGNRLFPMAILPIWDADALASETRRCIEDLGLKGFVIPDQPAQYGIPGFLSSHWAPFFEICNDRKVPINFHFASGLDGFSLTWQDFPYEKKMAIGSMLFYLGNAATMANFLMSGLFDKYTDLRMVSVESGIGWVPFVLEALEYQFDEMMPNESRKLQKRPTEYAREHFSFCYWFETKTMKNALEQLGIDSILFETDFPHPTALYPRVHEHIEETLGSLSQDSRKRILQDNAVELYHLPV